MVDVTVVGQGVESRTRPSDAVATATAAAALLLLRMVDRLLVVLVLPLVLPLVLLLKLMLSLVLLVVVLVPVVEVLSSGAAPIGVAIIAATAKGLMMGAMYVSFRAEGCSRSLCALAILTPAKSFSADAPFRLMLLAIFQQLNGRRKCYCRL